MPLWLRPLAALYGWLAAAAALPWRWGLRRPWRAPCPVLVVGNFVAGGAGKTPTVIALVQALRAAGWRPGVISRGHGRQTPGGQIVAPTSAAADVGDEPWLIAHAAHVPVSVDADRPRAAQALLAAHPDVNLLIADDGLHHRALARDAELWVFDARGVGNGALLPAGPLRQPLPRQVPAHARVLYNAPETTTRLPGALARRRLAGAVSLAQWHGGNATDLVALQSLAGRPVVAIAGIASPAHFFDMLRDAGLTVLPMPLPDHADLSVPPWPDGTPDVVCTEKDAAKLNPARCGSTRVWVVGLDFRLPLELIADLNSLLRRSANRP